MRRLRPKEKAVIGLLLGIVALSLIDIFSNIVSEIPGLGPVVKAAGESVIESVQIAMSVMLGTLAVKR